MIVKTISAIIKHWYNELDVTKEIELVEMKDWYYKAKLNIKMLAHFVRWFVQSIDQSMVDKDNDDDNNQLQV